jgi:hypothetical protein
LKFKYNFPRFGDLRARPRLPSNCSQFELVCDVRVCTDKRMRATLQSWLHTCWPLSKHPTAPEFATVVLMPSTPVTSEAKFSASEVEVKIAVCEGDSKTSTPASTLTQSASGVLPSSQPYDPSRCDHDCPLCAKRFEGNRAVCKKALAKHVRLNHEPNPDHLRFKAWMEAAVRSWCTDCKQSYSRRCAHKCKGPPVSPEMSSPRLVCLSVADPEVKVAEPEQSRGACILPDWMEAFSTSIPSVKRVPQQCRVLVAKAFTTLARNCSTSSTKEQELRAWKLFFLFPKCVLRLQPEVRGGRNKRLKRNETLRAGLLERLNRWNEGQVDVLWAEARKLFSGTDRKTETDLLTSNIRRATE